MEVIGAGFQKTGTSSLRLALDRLGYVTFHGGYVHSSPARMAYWLEAFLQMEQGKPADEALDWPLHFQRLANEPGSGPNFTATTDFPTALFYKEILKIYPKAKVVLTVRDEERWFESRIEMMTWELCRMRAWTFRMLYCLGHPRYTLYLSLCDMLEKYAYGHPMTEDIRQQSQSKADYIAAIKKHQREVIATVPPDQLLVFRVQEGWPPLCRFLGKPVPKEPFPHANENFQELTERVRSWIVPDILEAPYYLLFPYPNLSRTGRTSFTGWAGWPGRLVRSSVVFLLALGVVRAVIRTKRR
eukprot:gb/GEZN01012623.1/.p1 GENE.gb/GEZN01012623.1/~~gb/GEZN01012623.1/.p1  ORF type:complete len:300 (+),score=23.91 gb/GEZN01012623.1/:62-961(+)